VVSPHYNMEKHHVMRAKRAQRLNDVTCRALWSYLGFLVKLFSVLRGLIVSRNPNWVKKITIILRVHLRVLLQHLLCDCRSAWICGIPRAWEISCNNYSLYDFPVSRPLFSRMIMINTSNRSSVNFWYFSIHYGHIFFDDQTTYELLDGRILD